MSGTFLIEEEDTCFPPLVALVIRSSAETLLINVAGSAQTPRAPTATYIQRPKPYLDSNLSPNTKEMRFMYTYLFIKVNTGEGGTS